MITSRPLIAVGSGVFPKHMIIGKFILVVLLGLAAGYGLGVTYDQDAERGRTITLEEYIADFDTYRADLQSYEMPMAGAIATGVIMVAGLFALYEAIALALGWLVSLLFPSSRSDMTLASATDVGEDLGT